MFVYYETFKDEPLPITRTSNYLGASEKYSEIFYQNTGKVDKSPIKDKVNRFKEICNFSEREI